MNFLIQSHLSRLFMSRLWFDLWHKGSFVKIPQKGGEVLENLVTKTDLLFFHFFFEMNCNVYDNTVDEATDSWGFLSWKLGSLQVKSLREGFPGKIHFVYADRSRQRRHTYIRTYACRHQTFRKKQLAKLSIYNSLNFLEDLETFQHPTALQRCERSVSIVAKKSSSCVANVPRLGDS